MPPNKPPQLVCLDAGFTLIRPRQTMEERLADVLGARGHAATSGDLHRAWEVADAWFWDEYRQPGNLSWTSDEQIGETWRSYHGMMLASLGFPDADRELLDAILESQHSAEAWELYPDTLDALRRLHATRDLPVPFQSASARRPRLAIVSDFGSRLADIIRGVGLDPWIDFVLASGDVGLAKPDPAFFQLACQRAGVEPAVAVMVGDSFRADVVGARAAGMRAVLLDREGIADAVDPDVPVARDLVSAVGYALRGA